MKIQNTNRLETIYKQSTLKSPYTEWLFLHRFWVFQAERIPLLVMFILIFAIMFAIVRSSHQTSISNLIIATCMGVLYLLQIRLSDEPKDFEHDSKYYPQRPVQRGLITLSELRNTNNIIIIMFFVLALLTRSWTVFLLTCFQQGYAVLTRKEFFIREWLRAHFLMYQFSHYIQLLILDWLVLSVLNVQPISKKIMYFIFVILLIAMVESTRTIGNTDDQNANDRYSNRLGINKALLGFICLVAVSSGYTIFLVQSLHAHNNPVVLIPSLIFVFYTVNQYRNKPAKKNEQLLQLAALLLLLSSATTLALN
jgi:hypothetical protein